MGIDLPPVSSTDIQTELNKPLSQEVVSIGSCENPDFQKQFQLLQSQTKNETFKLQNEIIFTQKQKEILRKIYQNLGEDNPELKQAIENQTIKIFEVPGRDLIALSIDGISLSAFYKEDGSYYFEMNERRKNELKYKLFLKGIEKYGLEEIVNEKGVYVMKKNGKELQTFSPEYYQAILEYIDFLKGFFKTTKELLEKKEQGLIIE